MCVCVCVGMSVWSQHDKSKPSDKLIGQFGAQCSVPVHCQGIVVRVGCVIFAAF